jgi:hypothetical protein
MGISNPAKQPRNKHQPFGALKGQQPAVVYDLANHVSPHSYESRQNTPSDSML